VRGAQGRIVSATIADYMATDLVSFAPDDTIVDAMRVLLERQISGAPVIDQSAQMVGILSQKDCFAIVYNAAYHQEWGGQVQQYMSREVEHLEADCSVVDAADRFLHSNFRRFPVLREGRLVGLISRRDILRALDELYLRPGRKISG
jgi:predicted transcriptional regulator